jgi:hypothetical protein
MTGTTSPPDEYYPTLHQPRRPGHINHKRHSCAATDRDCSKENRMNIEDKIAAMRAGRAVQTQAVPFRKKQVVSQAAPEAAALVATASSTETVFDIANNTVAKLMDRSDLTDKGKLQAVVEFLGAKDADYQTAQKNFAEFEAYFTYEQSKRTQVSEVNIERLMSELADGTKSTVKQILDDFNVVNAGAGKIKQLLRVMEKARSDGRTVEVMTAAYRFNESLLKELASLKEFLAIAQKREASDSLTNERLAEQQRQSQGRHLKNLFGVIGPSQNLSEAIYYASHSLKTTQAKIQKLQHDLAEKEQQRNLKLEDGELTILRTVDATEGGLTDQILQTATDSLALIKGTRASIERLIAANARSHLACDAITKTLNGMVSGETILKGALQVVAKETHAQGQLLRVEVDTQTKATAEAAGDAAQLTLLTVILDKTNQTNQASVNYERVLHAKVVAFEMLGSANVQAEARAQQFSSLVESQHELLSNLEQQALPITASALEMGLQQAVALRDGLLAAGVRSATKKAQEIFGSNLEGATGVQAGLESESLAQMRAAIEALGQAQTLIVGRTDKAIERGLVSLELVETVKSSAGAVRAAMADFQKVDGVLASRGAGADPPATHEGPGPTGS